MLEIFEIALRLTISGNFKCFQYFLSIWKRKAFFKKLGNLFLFESTKIENTSFPYKTAISEVNVKVNRMVTTKNAITKNGVLPVTTLFFKKFVSV